MIDQISTASIERLYKLNTLRDFLISNNAYLKNIGILKVDAFGSAIDGMATEKSDLDLIFYISGSVDYNKDSSKIEEVYFVKLLPLLVKSGLVHGQSNSEEEIDLHIQIVFIEKISQQAGYSRNSVRVWSA